MKTMTDSFPLSRAQVSAILDQNTFQPDPADKFGMLPIEMKFMQFGEIGEDGNHVSINMLETKARIAQWCRDAFALVDPRNKNEELGSHLEQLDALLSTLMTCNFVLHKKKLDKEEIVNKACLLLARLPSQPPELQYEGQYGIYSPWPTEYLGPSESEAGGRFEWTNLRVLSRPSTNVVRIALFLVMEPSSAFILTSDHSDTIVSLLDTVAELSQSSATDADAQAWFVLQAFLWAAWQQTVMLQLWYDATKQLQLGYMFESHNQLISKEIPSIMPRRHTIEQVRPEYMCKWAFELFRSDLSLVTQDFRRVFEIYNLHFGGRAPRCNLATSPRVCDGKAPGNCQRFESEGVIQAAHDVDCPGPSACSVLTWDEQSYKNVTGARAVCIEETDGKHIRYCPLSSETMAVSHVWSHGQGGRPETGFNICLHRRYTALARSLNCTSYWMDSPCIPSDHELRNEAIAQINDSFANSKLTLLVDRDLMEIPIHPLTLQAEEAILAALVVCDWNVRAWTLLEGMQGRLNLTIMAKDNHTIPLLTVLSDIVSKSTLDLVSPCLAIEHYTPTRGHKISYREPVTTEQATCLLNHRHATKDRDVPMIWSLISASTTANTTKVLKTAEDFWKSKSGEMLATGFLVSSAPRIKQVRGLSWAPSRPNLLPPSTTTTSTKQYPAFDGQNSVAGEITLKGFKAEWLACPIRRLKAFPKGVWFSVHTYTDSTSHTDAYYRIYNPNLNTTTSTEKTTPPSKPDLRDLLTLRTLIAPLLKQYRWVSLLLPALRHRTSSGAVAPPRPFPYQGEVQGLLLVVVASDDGVEWEWQFVSEWDVKVPLPEFSLEEILIV